MSSELNSLSFSFKGTPVTMTFNGTVAGELHEAFMDSLYRLVPSYPEILGSIHRRMIENPEDGEVLALLEESSAFTEVNFDS